MMMLINAYSTDVSFIASQAVARGQQKTDPEGADREEASEATDAMAALERQARVPQGFVAASTATEGGSEAAAQAKAVEIATNPDALEIELED